MRCCLRATPGESENCERLANGVFRTPEVGALGEASKRPPSRPEAASSLDFDARKAALGIGLIRQEVVEFSFDESDSASQGNAFEPGAAQLGALGDRAFDGHRSHHGEWPAVRGRGLDCIVRHALECLSPSIADRALDSLTAALSAAACGTCGPRYPSPVIDFPQVDIVQR